MTVMYFGGSCRLDCCAGVVLFIITLLMFNIIISRLRSAGIQVGNFKKKIYLNIHQLAEAHQV